ncbi:MAG TPA: hypothetical protein VF559_10235 [Caulobacteraceae bacterium]|jgi:hypothetical protein
MTNARYPAAALAAAFALGSAAPAAADAYERMFFVKPGATAAAMFDDRDACAARADALDVEQAPGYSDAEFGALAAMAAALEADGGGDGKVRATVRRVALERCMERRGWTLLDPKPEDVKAIRKASRKRPEPLEAWLKLNEPKTAPAAAPAAQASAAAAPVADTPVPAAASGASAPTAPTPTAPASAAAPAPSPAAPPSAPVTPPGTPSSPPGTAPADPT